MEQSFSFLKLFISDGYCIFHYMEKSSVNTVPFCLVEESKSYRFDMRVSKWLWGSHDNQTQQKSKKYLSEMRCEQSEMFFVCFQMLLWVYLCVCILVRDQRVCVCLVWCVFLVSSRFKRSLSICLSSWRVSHTYTRSHTWVSYPDLTLPLLVLPWTAPSHIHIRRV